MDAALLTLAACATALATGIGAVPVLLLGPRIAAMAAALWGAAGGVMVVAAIAGLLLPALEESGTAGALAGLTVGVLAMSVSSFTLRRRSGLHLGTLDGPGARRAFLVAGTLFAHSLPEGLAIGAAWASGGAPGAFVVFAIALQNVPEGMVTALPLREAGFSSTRIFWAAVATSAPQVPGALLAYWAVTSVDNLLGFSYGLAAGAMLALVILEVSPAARERPARGAAGAVAGVVVMTALAIALKV